MKNLFRSLIVLISAFSFFACGSDDATPPTHPSEINKILSFKINGISGTISNFETSGSITLTLHPGVSNTSLTPEIDLSPGATVAPSKGSTLDFSNEVEYTVTDANGESRRYKVNVYMYQYSLGNCYPNPNDPASAIGIVFKLTDNRTHGKILSIDRTTGLAWSNYDREEFDGAVIEGAASIEWIKNNRNLNEYPAFMWCADKGDGWYLPTTTDLNDIIHKSDLFGNTIWGYYVNPVLETIPGAKLFALDDLYLSSIEFSEQYAIALKITNSGFSGTYAPKKYTQDCYVRAVKDF